MSKNKAVVIASGGLDSAVLASACAERYDVLMLGFDYGQRHRKELEHMRRMAALLGQRAQVVELAALTQDLGGSALTDAAIPVPDGHYAEDSMRATVVPNRNMIMLAIAGGFAVAQGAALVAIGVHAGDHFIYPDCRPPFIDAARAALVLGNDGFAVSGFSLEAPFLHMTKAEIVGLGAALGVPFEQTWSCYKGGAIHCGTCGTCVERIEAFRLAGVEDPTSYTDTSFALGVVG